MIQDKQTNRKSAKSKQKGLQWHGIHQGL